MSALFVPDKVAEVGQNGLQNLESLLGLANSEEFLHHVVAVLMHDEINQRRFDVVDDGLDVFLAALIEVVLEDAGLSVVFDKI